MFIKLFSTRSFESIFRRAIPIAILDLVLLVIFWKIHFLFLTLITFFIAIVSMPIIFVCFVSDIFSGYVRYKLLRFYKGNDIYVLDEFKKSIFKHDAQYELTFNNIKSSLGPGWMVNDRRIFDIVKNINPHHSISAHTGDHVIRYAIDNSDIITEFYFNNVTLRFSNVDDYNKAKLKYDE